MLNVKTNISDETIAVVDDNLIKVEMAYIGEGYNGDYDENNPEDKPLLRFYTYINTHHGTDDSNSFWEDLEDGSCCTTIPKDSDITHIVDAAKKILAELRKTITCYDEEKGIPSAKHVAEKMSWLD